MELSPSKDEQITIHGTLVAIDNEGVLFRGAAGIGKSTAALELLAFGGQLVADDVVVIKRVGEELHGTAPELLKGILAIPKLGIFDIREVFGENHYVPSVVIKRCIDLSRIDEAVDGEEYAIFHGLKVPRSSRKVSMQPKTPIVPGSVDLFSVKESEASFIHGHSRLIASSKAH